MGESGLQNSLSKMLSKPPREGERADKAKGKKPVIKKSRLDLRKKQNAHNSLKKSSASIKQSTVINSAKPAPAKRQAPLKQIWPDQRTFENFLSHHKIRFLKKDTQFLLRDFGGLGDSLYEDRFKRFFHSNVWEA